MENQKKTPRAQSHANNVNLSHQVPSTPSAKFNNTTTTNPTSFSHNKYFGSNQPELARSKNKGRGNYTDRHHGYGKQRMAQQNHSNNGHQRERKLAHSEQSNEVSGRKQRSGVVDKSSRHGESASHLLNFTYSSPRNNEGGQRRGAQQWRSSRARRQPVHTKEQFLQAHCQFVVKRSISESPYAQYMADPDKMVEWEDIEQVVLRDEQISNCPICMDIPVAAKITKCAHIYCWPCMLHYLSLTDRAWGRCPICFDSVEEKDLKSVVTQALSKPKVGDEVTFYLMKREREALYLRPKSSWRAADAGHLFEPEDNSEDIRYSKLLSATADHIENIIREERRQLVHLLNSEDTQSLEASFVQAALDSLTTRLERLGGSKCIPAAEVSEQPVVIEPQAEPSLASIKSAPNLRTVEYSDAFDEVAESSVLLDSASQLADVCPSPPAESVSSLAESVNPLAESVSPPAESVSPSVESVNPPAESVSPPAGSVSPPAGSVRHNSGSSDTSARKRTVSSNSSADGTEAEQLAADLVLPPTGTQPGHSSGSKRTEVYYFYQAADGQHVYLHSINTRILAAEYGSLEMAPTVLTATIVESEENSVTPELRKRLKYLSHLPLHSQFSVCEVVLRPPVVSSACLSHFTEEINQRKKMRNRRQRTEARQYNRAQAEERRRMGQYPDMALSLDSDRHFPTRAALSSEAPSLAEFAPLTSTQDSLEQPVASELAEPGRQHEVPLTTPYSFSQAMKGGAPGAVWPRVQSSTNYVRSSGAQSAPTLAECTDTVEGEEASVPSFKQSFSADFELANITSSLSVEDTANTTGKGGKRSKDKKRKKQLVLFSTSGQRAAP